MNLDFVNRTQDFCTVTEWIQEPTENNKNKCMFVASLSGVGKSRFVAELFEFEPALSNYQKIKVVMTETEATTVDSFSFLRRLYRKVLEVTEKDEKLPLHKSIKMEPNISISQILGVGLGVSYRERTGYSEDIAFIIKYLHDKLTNSLLPFIINIENFHLIDSDSLECFKQLFQAGGGRHRFIFEYTMNPSNPSTSFMRIFNSISDYLDCELYELKKLEMQEIHVLCEKTNISFSAAENIYNQEEGNLLPLIMLRYKPRIRNKNSILLDVIKDLTDDEKIILFLIELERDVLSIEIICDMFLAAQNLLSGSYKYTKQYLQIQCSSLIQKGVLIASNRKVRIQHDQLTEIIIKYRRTPLYFLACQIFETYHEQQLKGQERKEYHVMSLLHVYSINANMQVVTILPELTKILLKQKSKSAIDKVREIKDKMVICEENKYIVEKLTQYLADICIAAGYWHAAAEQIKDIYSEDVPWQACYLAAILAANPDSPSIEHKIVHMRNKHKINLNAYMSITVSLYSYYLRTLTQKKAEVLGKEFIEEFKETDTLNYAFLLKNYSNTLENSEALTILNKCSELFKKHNRYDLVAMNNITIVSRKVYTGNIEEALALLDETETAIRNENIPIRQYYFYNNRSAILLLQGNLNPEIEQYLSTAEVLTDSTFEKAIILCNIMIYYLLSSRNKDATFIYKKLQSLNLAIYNNIDLKLIVKKNQLFYFETIGDEKSAERARADLLQLYMLEDCPNDIKQIIASLFPAMKTKGLTEEYHILSQFRFHPEFIGYWQYEVSYSDDSSSRLTTLSMF